MLVCSTMSSSILSVTISLKNWSQSLDHHGMPVKVGQSSKLPTNLRMILVMLDSLENMVSQVALSSISASWCMRMFDLCEVQLVLMAPFIAIPSIFDVMHFLTIFHGFDIP